MTRLLQAFILLSVLCFAAGAASDESRPGTIEVGMLVYGGDDDSSVCFSGLFLRDVKYETEIEVASGFTPVRLDSEALFDHPFVIMSGEGAFELRAEEVENIRRYLNGGGFLLASAGCSNAPWNASMRRSLNRIFPDVAAEELPIDHEVFQTIYDITEFQSKRRSRTVRIYGIEVNDRLALVYSPEGLNDTRNAGNGCCCCGGNEVRNARYINANILAYALMK
ncbi:MAG: DUF4159 domain-containing protein [Phycisphaerales bacterium]